jgi:glyoxylase-like metal-dependent hydrolase (beta-lactamase superfamily II)
MTRNNCNTYLIDAQSRILIDPGHLDLFDHVRRGLAERDLDLKDIDLVICTHAHPDHIEAVQLFHETTAKVAYHEKDWELAKSMLEPFGAAYQARIEAIRPDFFLAEGELNAGDTRFEVYHTPGHDPGAICLYQPDQKVLVTGDLIFKEGVGRTDLPGGNGNQLKDSIRRLADLDVEWILPGHGGIVSGATEVRRTFEQMESFWFAHI